MTPLILALAILQGVLAYFAEEIEVGWRGYCAGRDLRLRRRICVKDSCPYRARYRSRFCSREHGPGAAVNARARMLRLLDRNTNRKAWEHFHG